MTPTPADRLFARYDAQKAPPRTMPAGWWLLPAAALGAGAWAALITIGVRYAGS